MAALLLVWAGCGDDEGADGAGGGGDVTVETGSLSKAEFVKRADRICKTTREEFQRDFDAFVKANPNAGINAKGKIIDQIFVPSYQSLIDGIVAVGAPAGDEEPVSAFVDSLQSRIDELKKQPDKAFENLSPFERSAKLAAAYGLNGCAQSLS